MLRHVLVSSLLLLLVLGCDTSSDDVVPDGGGGGDVADPVDAVTGEDGAGEDDVLVEVDVSEPPPADRDEDGVPDDDDAFPDDPCEAHDMDLDGIGDGSDPDRDGDGVDDRWERWVGTDPNDPSSTPDETDTDDDGVPDYRDRFPEDPDHAEDDFDGDGLPDADDPDDDDDDILDVDEESAGSDPYTVTNPDRCVLSHSEGWYTGDLHAHTEYSDGLEDMETWVGLHEWYEDPRFLARHPEYEGHGLDFQALTDHRTILGTLDPAFQSDLLVLLPGEEVGGPSHGNAIGMMTRIDHDPRDGETYAERMRACAEQIHWQGGTFQANHPFSPGITWPADFAGLDAIEIWNMAWSVERSATEEEYDDKVAGEGWENPYSRQALLRESRGANAQALAAWENSLVCGLHPAVVGGSDRHMFFPPGFPATHVYARRLAHDDLLDGIRAGHTTISRGPIAAEIALWLRGESSDEVLVGGELAVPDEEALTVRLELKRGAGHLIQFVAGPVSELRCEEALTDFEGGTVVATHEVPGDARDSYAWEGEIEIPRPGWLYARVLEPIQTDGLSTEAQTTVATVVDAMHEGLDEPIMDLISLLIPLLSGLDPAGLDPCTEECWEVEGDFVAECMLPDQKALYTYFMPDVLMAVINLWLGEAPEGDFALGATTSAFVVTAP